MNVKFHVLLINEAAFFLDDHPYLESTTLLSDILRYSTGLLLFSITVG